MLISALMAIIGCTPTDKRSSTANPTRSQAKAGPLPPAAKPEPVKLEPLMVIESGYTVVQSQYRGRVVQFGLVLANPNPVFAAESPKVKITLLDRNRQVISTYNQSLRRISPGETVILSGQANANDEAPQKVTFEPSVGDTNWKSAGEANYQPFGIDKLAAKENSTGITFTGELFNPNSEDFKQLSVSVILRDDHGKIIAGYNGYVNDVPANDTLPFEVVSIDKIPDYSKLEAYATIWVE